MSDKPGYYGIMPATVRYSKKINSFCKVLFTDITALCNKNGFCNAKNSTLADWHGVSDSTISKSITMLSKAGFLKVVITKNATGTFRKIYPVTDSLLGGEEDITSPIVKDYEGGEEDITMQSNTIKKNSIKKNIRASAPKTKEQRQKETFEQNLACVNFGPVTGKLKELTIKYLQQRQQIQPDFVTVGAFQVVIKQIYKIAADPNQGKVAAMEAVKLSTEKGYKSIDYKYLINSGYEPQQQQVYSRPK